MSKLFIFIFIAFFTITLSIIFFTDDKKEDSFEIKDKNVEKVIQKKIYTAKEDYLIKEKTKERKEKFIQSKKEEIEKKSEEIDTIISKADKLIEENNLKVQESTNEENKKRVDKINKQYNELKDNIDKL